MAIKVTRDGIQRSMTYMLYVLLFIFLGTLIFILLVPKYKEEFQTMNSPGVSSRSLYRTSRNFDNDVSGLHSVLLDRDDLILVAGCYQFNNPSVDPSTYLPSDCYVESIGIYTNSFEEVRSKIGETLKSLAQRVNGKRLNSDAFVLLLQSPFLRDNVGNIIAVQFNISMMNFDFKRGPSSTLADRPLFIRAYIILPMYNRELMLKPSSTDVMAQLAQYRTNKDQCFMKCVGESNSYCGCLITKKNPSDPRSYASACSSTPDFRGDTNRSKNIPVNFGILYRINKKARYMVESNIFPI